MANQDTANIRGDLWDVFIDGNPAPFSMFVNRGKHLDTVPVTTQRHGTTPIASIIQGHMCALSFEFQEWTIDNIKMWDGIVAATASVNDLPALGTLLPTHAVRLHNPSDGADTSKDLVYPAVVFHGHANNSDGQGELRLPVEATALLDAASGKVARIGYVAP